MEFFRQHILSVVLFTPVAGAVLALFIPREKDEAHRVLGNVFGMLGFIVSVPLVWWFNPDAAGFQFKENLDWVPSIGAHYTRGIDGISFLLVMLTTVLGAISILSSWSAIQLRKKEYYILFLLLQTGMLGVFMSLDFFLFYVFWEVMLVAIYFKAGGTTFDVPALLNAAANFPDSLKVWLFWAFFFAFAIKVPMFPFHTWLPDAHTEAPRRARSFWPAS